MSKLNLLDINFAEKDAEVIEKELIDAYEKEADISLAIGDPRKKMLQAQVPILIGQRVNIDYAAKQNLLAYAKEDYLDHIGILIGVTRLPATAASVTQRFTLSEKMKKMITIPAGTRVTAGDGNFFATVAEKTILPGETYADVKAICIEAGNNGNGYAAGDLNTIVDPIPYVAATANMTESEGGADPEDDESFRERIHQAPEKFSTAGPDEAYVYWAKTASVLISDVSVSSPTAGVVDIRVLLQEGEIPRQEILDEVMGICNARKRRPLTDKVEVKAPEVVHYNLELTYYIGQENASVAAGIREKIEEAIRGYILWQKTALGRDLNPSELTYRIREAGAKRVAIVTPVFQVIEKYQVAIEQTVSASYGGLEDG